MILLKKKKNISQRKYRMLSAEDPSKKMELGCISQSPSRQHTYAGIIRGLQRLQTGLINKEGGGVGVCVCDSVMYVCRSRAAPVLLTASL